MRVNIIRENRYLTGTAVAMFMYDNIYRRDQMARHTPFPSPLPSLPYTYPPLHLHHSYPTANSTTVTFAITECHHTTHSNALTYPSTSQLTLPSYRLSPLSLPSIGTSLLLTLLLFHFPASTYHFTSSLAIHLSITTTRFLLILFFLLYLFFIHIVARIKFPTNQVSYKRTSPLNKTTLHSITSCTVLV